MTSVACADGCGALIEDTDSRGRPRRYLFGHGGGNVPRLQPTTDFSRRLRWLMEHGPNGAMRQVDVARRARELGILGLNSTEVNHLVTGKYDPKLSTLAKLARVLGVSMAELLEPSSRRVAVLPLAWWTGQRFARTSETVDVPITILPERTGDLVAFVFDHDVLVVDPTAVGAPINGALVLVISNPASTQLLLMRANLEDNEVRYADAAGYVMGTAELCKGEVVAVLSRVSREPEFWPTKNGPAPAQMAEAGQKL